MGTSDSIKYSGKEWEDIIQDYFFRLSFILFHLHRLHKKNLHFPFCNIPNTVILLSVSIHSGIEESSLDKLF